MWIYMLFIIGFVSLVKGADWLVAGSASIAKKYNVSDLVIGLTIVSMGTSMPELIVNILASTSDVSDIAIGNVVGSNIANVLLILGIAACISPLGIKESTVFSEIPYSILALLIVAFAANAPIFNPNYELIISRFDGIIFLFFFALFMTYVTRLARKGRSNITEEAPEKDLPMGKSILFVLLGMTGLFLGGKWVVNGAVTIAQEFGLSENMIGLTIVAIGTSLPELVTSAMAAYKKNTDIAIANVIGSNIFNLLWVLGLSAIINPMKYDPVINTDIVVLIVASCLIILSLMKGKNRKMQIGKPTGVLFLTCYISYLTYVVMRG